MTDKPHLGADAGRPEGVRIWRADFDSKDDRRLLHLWRQSYDTIKIAALMMRTEAEVSNRLMHIRGARIKNAADRFP